MFVLDYVLIEKCVVRIFIILDISLHFIDFQIQNGWKNFIVIVAKTLNLKRPLPLCACVCVHVCMCACESNSNSIILHMINGIYS